MNYSETYSELDSEEATHCDHCHLIYIKGHVEPVNTKDQSNAIVYCVWYLVCQHCRYEDQSMNAIFVETVDTLVFVALTQHLKQSAMRCENSTLPCIKWPLTLQYKTHPHVSAHNFLNIQPIFNLQKVLES